MAESLPAGSLKVHKALRSAFAGFSAWYKRELQSLFPSSLLAWLTDTRERGVMLALRGDTIEMVSLKGRRAVSSRFVPRATWSQELALGSINGTRSDRICLAIPRHEFLVRKLTVPQKAVRSLDQLLNSELERQTPLRRADVVQAYTSVPAKDNARKADVEHWIIRKNLVNSYATTLQVPFDRIAFVRPLSGDDAQPTGPQLAIRPGATRRRWPIWLAVSLTVSAISMVSIDIVQKYRAFAREREVVTLKLTSAAARAAAVRRDADFGTREHALVASLYRQKSDLTGLLDLWEEITRLLPDGTFITEFRLTEAKPGDLTLAMSGFSTAATALVALLDTSPLLADTTLTSAITGDPVEQRDRFSLQARLVKRGVK